MPSSATSSMCSPQSLSARAWPPSTTLSLVVSWWVSPSLGEASGPSSSAMLTVASSLGP